MGTELTNTFLDSTVHADYTFLYSCLNPGVRFSSVVRVFHSWCDGSSDRSLIVEPLSIFLFQPVLHDWFIKGCGMCYPVCGMVHIKEPLLLIGKGIPCGGSRFSLALSVRCHITITKCVECVVK